MTGTEGGPRLIELSTEQSQPQEIASLLALTSTIAGQIEPQKSTTIHNAVRAFNDEHPKHIFDDLIANSAFVYNEAAQQTGIAGSIVVGGDTIPVNTNLWKNEQLLLDEGRYADLSASSRLTIIASELAVGQKILEMSVSADKKEQNQVKALKALAPNGDLVKLFNDWSRPLFEEAQHIWRTEQKKADNWSKAHPKQPHKEPTPKTNQIIQLIKQNPRLATAAGLTVVSAAAGVFGFKVPEVTAATLEPQPFTEPGDAPTGIYREIRDLKGAYWKLAEKIGTGGGPGESGPRQGGEGTPTPTEGEEGTLTPINATETVFSQTLEEGNTYAYAKINTSEGEYLLATRVVDNIEQVQVNDGQHWISLERYSGVSTNTGYNVKLWGQVIGDNLYPVLWHYDVSPTAWDELDSQYKVLFFAPPNAGDEFQSQIVILPMGIGENPETSIFARRNIQYVSLDQAKEQFNAPVLNEAVSAESAIVVYNANGTFTRYPLHLSESGLQPEFLINENGELVWPTNTPEINAVLSSSGDWTLVQEETTNGLRILMDIKYNSVETRSALKSMEISYIYDIHAKNPEDGPMTDGYSNTTIDSNTESMVVSLRGSLDNPNWYQEGQSGLANIEQTFVVFYTMLQENTAVPNDAIVQDNMDKFYGRGAYEGQPLQDMIVTVDGKQLNIRNVDILYSPVSPTGWPDGIEGTIPNDFFTVADDGTAQFRITGSKMGAWSTSTPIAQEMILLLQREGLQGNSISYDGFENFTMIWESLCPVVTDAHGVQYFMLPLGIIESQEPQSTPNIDSL